MKQTDAVICRIRCAAVIFGLFFVLAVCREQVAAAGFENFITPFEGLVIPPTDADVKNPAGTAGKTADTTSGEIQKEKEPNNDIASANPINAKKPVTGTTAANNDIDIYRFKVDRTAYYNISLKHKAFNFNGSMWFAYLRDNTGKLVNKTTDHVFSYAQQAYAESKPVKLKKGNYYITVVGYASAIGQEYTLSVNRITADRPKLISAEPAGYDGVTLTWEAVPGASAYQVYRSVSKGGGFKKVATLKSIKETKWTDEKLITGKKYYYKIKAQVLAGKKSTSGFSNTVFAKPLPAAAGLVTFVSEKKITLRWSRVAGADGYEIFRSTKADGTYKMIKNVKKGKTTSYTDKKKKSGTTYYYKMRAYRNVKGKKLYGAYSNTAFGIVSGA